MPQWQKHPLDKLAIRDELKAGRAVAVGVLAGPASGGLLFVDHDGPGASVVLETLGTSLQELPKSWAVTSGRDGRLQIIYRVPQPFWDKIKTTKLRSPTPNEQLELRWTGCQSVVIGKHPLTGAYRWLKGRAPSDLPLAEAPSSLLSAMHRRPEAPLLIQDSEVDDTERARTALDNIPSALADSYDDWVKVGMALHSVGNDALLADWIQWSSASGKFEPGVCEAKWRTFKADVGGVTLGTLIHLAGGINPRQVAVNAIKGALGAEHPVAKQAAQSNDTKLIKLSKNELLTLLRQQLGDRLRFNIFTQGIERDGEPIKQIDLYYLELAEHGIDASKERAADVLVKVAMENPYDPVRAYLDRVAEQTTPADISALSGRFLRPQDASGSLYDQMLRCTLIGAVRRIYEPGSKHDAATVLLGPQGCGKSTFWRVLGGPFFSDSLRDCSSKDDLMVLHRSWLMEWAELDYITGKRHAGQVKAFLSQQTDTFRVPYGKTTEDFPRRCIIVGSTNKDTGFLVDDTGNRRFWVIPTAVEHMIDIDTLLLERDAIWAAAVHAYRAGETNHLPREASLQVEAENISYTVESPWAAPIRDWIREPRHEAVELTTERLLTDAIGKPVERQSRSDQMQVASILKQMGLKKRRRRVDGSLKWVWFQP